MIDTQPNKTTLALSLLVSGLISSAVWFEGVAFTNDLFDQVGRASIGMPGLPVTFSDVLTGATRMPESWLPILIPMFLFVAIQLVWMKREPGLKTVALFATIQFIVEVIRTGTTPGLVDFSGDFRMPFTLISLIDDLLWWLLASWIFCALLRKLLLWEAGLEKKPKRNFTY